jgi:hypothetical protein
MGGQAMANAVHALVITQVIGNGEVDAFQSAWIF